MKPKWLVMGSAAALVLAAAAVGYGSFATAQPYGGGWGMMGRGGYGPGMMQGYGPGGGYGPGMMGRWGGGGYGPQNCPWLRDGAGGYQQQGNLNLSTDDVKVRFERWLAVRGNPHLKLGEIKEKDGDTITVDVVTKDNSLVEQFLVDRHTGVSRPSGG